jgi:hypothetical protein
VGRQRRVELPAGQVVHLFQLGDGANGSEGHGHRATPGFRVKDKLFARIRPEGDVRVVWCEDLAEKEAMIASEPDKFFTTPHYDGHPTVLVRFSAVDTRS